MCDWLSFPAREWSARLMGERLRDPIPDRWSLALATARAVEKIPQVSPPSPGLPETSLNFINVYFFELYD